MKRTSPNEATRTLILHRDGYKCVICGKDLDRCATGYSIHHRRMRSHEWEKLNSPSNLISVCGSGTTGCHGRIHAHPEDAYNNGWLIHSWCDEPESVPITTYRGMALLDDDGHKRHTG